MARRCKGRKDATVGLLFPIFCPAIPAFSPVIPVFSSVIPAKAGIQRFADAVGARASRPQSRANARRTLILAFSHKGRRDPLAVICT